MRSDHFSSSIGLTGAYGSSGPNLDPNFNANIRWERLHLFVIFGGSFDPFKA